MNMKRLICLLLALCMVLSMGACASDTGNEAADQPDVSAETPEAPQDDAADDAEPAASEEEPAESTDPAASAESDAPETAAEDASGSVEVDENLLTVDITMPASYVETGTTQESLDADVEAGTFLSATLNEDGSVTYTMTRAQHSAMLEELAASIDASLEEMISSGSYPTFVSAEANDNYSLFTVTISSDTVAAEDSLAVLGLYLFGMMYQMMESGSQDANVNVQFCNEAGELIEEFDSAEMG